MNTEPVEEPPTRRRDALVLDRYGYWFPLVLLGFLLLGWLGLSAAHAGDYYPDGGWFSGSPLTGVSGTGIVWQGYASLNDTVTYSVNVSSLPLSAAYWNPSPQGWLWLAPIAATFLATLVWYGWLARRAGSTAVRPLVLVAVAGVLTIALAYTVFGLVATTPGGWDPIASVGLPLVAFGVVAAAWSYVRRGPGRRTAAVLGAIGLYVGVCVVLASWSPRLLDPVLVMVGLLVLAWLERSGLLAVVAVAVLAAMVALPTGILGVLVPATALLIGGIAALVLRARPATGTMAG